MATTVALLLLSLHLCLLRAFAVLSKIISKIHCKWDLQKDGFVLLYKQTWRHCSISTSSSCEACHCGWKGLGTGTFIMLSTIVDHRCSSWLHTLYGSILTNAWPTAAEERSGSHKRRLQQQCTGQSNTRRQVPVSDGYTASGTE